MLTPILSWNVQSDAPKLIFPSFSSFFKWWIRFTLAAPCRCSGVSWITDREMEFHSNTVNKVQKWNRFLHVHDFKHLRTFKAHFLLKVNKSAFWSFRLGSSVENMRSDLVDDLDQLHGGESLSGSILNGCQDLLLSFLSVVDVVFDLHACVLDHRSVTCSHNRGKNAM